MKIWKNAVLFYLGGMGYCALELLWRGRTHGSMFVLGGVCFLILGRVGKLTAPLPCRAILGGICITAAELVTGLLLNRQFRVWDYRQLPLNFQGQICLMYSLLWIALSPAGWSAHRILENRLP